MRRSLKLALVVALASALWGSAHDGDSTVEPVKSSGHATSGRGEREARAPAARSVAPATSASAMADLSQLPLAISEWRQREPIGLKSGKELGAWAPSLPPPPPRPVAAQTAEPPPPPQAPRFPHPWVGRFNDMAVVSGPRSTWVLAPGQVVDGVWRVDTIEERRMQLTYLPLKQAQTVVMQTP